ncbi:sensor histidine kinase [Pontibacter cellulosilyticus]|uniref:Histidine kinase n=1 Tax=Pontibacter cellulosilyticus TaxID=1720253 RepID=A0A923N792_9BACT|nr:histidine kinase [Pontibacter cellulosilyticus]MBC5992192.1 histidine kinase [Pontibacter cellulosilyticus]
MKKQFLFLQIIGWLVTFALFFLYGNQVLGAFGTGYILAITVMSCVSFALIIYGYVYFVYPRFYKAGALTPLVLATATLYALAVVGRSLVEYLLLAPAYTLNTVTSFIHNHSLINIISCFIALVVGILLNSVVESMALQQREAEMKQRQAETELKLLKAQVQPHFLFNSFNNLYYDTYKALPDVAQRIAMLSEIMRYFLEESPKARVPIQTEIAFIKNYIELERVRLAKPLHIGLQVDENAHALVPPMLFMPLVENLFKHGLDKNAENSASITLAVQENEIDFVVQNRIVSEEPSARVGTGLKNLTERLQLIFKDKYKLATTQQGEYFNAHLKIPLL